MRFLYVMLSVVWMLYAWVCFDAMQWQPPYPIPWHAAQALQGTAPKTIELEIEQLQMILNAQDLPAFQKSLAHYRLATFFWMSAYLQDARQRQMAFLKMSMRELNEALRLKPDEAHLKYCLADLYHQMKEYEKAEPIYLDVIAQEPNNGLYRQRFDEMKDEIAALEDPALIDD